MSAIHRFRGGWPAGWPDDMRWEGARARTYDASGASGVVETWLIGKGEDAQHFALRYYRLEPGGHSREEDHPYDHGVLILHGGGEVLLGAETHAVGPGDVVYITPGERHQLRSTGDDPLGFLCIIPARRQKAGGVVWAEEGLDLETT
jgi:quercetin dioxygenase-like cupin family protein